WLGCASKDHTVVPANGSGRGAPTTADAVCGRLVHDRQGAAVCGDCAAPGRAHLRGAGQAPDARVPGQPGAAEHAGRRHGRCAGARGRDEQAQRARHGRVPAKRAGPVLGRGRVPADRVVARRLALRQAGAGRGAGAARPGAGRAGAAARRPRARGRAAGACGAHGRRQRVRRRPAARARHGGRSGGVSGAVLGALVVCRAGALRVRAGGGARGPDGVGRQRGRRRCGRALAAALAARAAASEQNKYI
ncbi:hypothetical protein H4S02_010276, partial [Coemansia sp. RSA 2611]